MSKIKKIKKQVETATKAVEDSYLKGTTRFNRQEIASAVGIVKLVDKKSYDVFQMNLTASLKKAGFIITKNDGEKISPFINIRRDGRRKEATLTSSAIDRKLEPGRWECRHTKPDESDVYMRTLTRMLAKAPYFKTVMKAGEEFKNHLFSLQNKMDQSQYQMLRSLYVEILADPVPTMEDIQDMTQGE